MLHDCLSYYTGLAVYILLFSFAGYTFVTFVIMPIARWHLFLR